MDFNINYNICGDEEITQQTLYFKDGCVYKISSGNIYIDKYSVVEPNICNPYQYIYTNKTTHIKQNIIVLYVDYLESPKLCNKL